MSHSWYLGAAKDYNRGRLPYPAALESTFEAAVGRGGRLLDVGCGPGTVGLRLAAGHGRVLACSGGSDGLGPTRFVRASAENLPADLGTFRVVVVAQAFHWFDRRRAAGSIRRLLERVGTAW